MSKNIAILGLGWLGMPLAKHLQKAGHSITGSTTRSEKLLELLKSDMAIKIIKVSQNIVRGSWNDFINKNEVLIIAIPPGKIGNKTQDYAAQILQIARGCQPTQKVIFISSTVVYGKQMGEIDELQTPRPSKEIGHFVVEAEEVIKQYFGSNATIVRFAGLIGPQRHPGRFVKASIPLSNPNGKVNLIHLDDCITLITAIIDKNAFGEIFNGCADEHPLRSEFYTKATIALGLKPPNYDSNQPAVDKIISNKKSKEVLGINYKYSNPELFIEQSF